MKNEHGYWVYRVKRRAADLTNCFEGTLLALGPEERSRHGSLLNNEKNYSRCPWLDEFPPNVSDPVIRETTHLPTNKTIDDVCDEVNKARCKHPGNAHLLAALMEEVGELSKAFLEKESPDRIYDEAKQVACVAIRIMEEGDGDFK